MVGKSLWFYYYMVYRVNLKYFKVLKNLIILLIVYCVIKSDNDKVL